MNLVCKKLEKNCNYTTFTDNKTGHLILPMDTIDQDNLQEESVITVKLDMQALQGQANHRRREEVNQLVRERVAKRLSRDVSGLSKTALRKRKERREKRLAG